MLTLKQSQPVAEGRQRYVYIHPENPDLVIKVIRPDAISRAWDRWYKIRRSHGQYLSYMREIGEYVATHAREGSSPPFLQRIEGLVETDMGLGLVLQAVRGEDGSLAPSLRAMLKDGTFDREAKAALEEFFRDLMASDVIAADLNGGNVVYASLPDGARRFVMIDGLGQHNLIPVKRLSRTLNLRGKVRRVSKLRRQIAAAHGWQDHSQRPPKRRTRFRTTLVTAGAAALAFFSFVLIPRENTVVSAELKTAPHETGAELTATPDTQETSGTTSDKGLNDFWQKDTRREPINPFFAQLESATAGTGTISDKTKEIRLAPWLQLVRPSWDSVNPTLINPYSNDPDGEDDMITSLEYAEPIIQ